MHPILRLILACLLATAPAAARAADDGSGVPIRFGILPVGGAVESRDSWQPLLADMGRAVGRPVTALSVTTYDSLARALERNEIDVALLSGKLALDAVLQGRMTVIAGVMRHSGTPDHRAVLLARKVGAASTLQGLLAEPERWRLARGDSRSVSGFILPQLQLFLPNKIEMETRFASEIVDTHQGTALAVANGDADVATNNTTDFERFKIQFPVEAERLHVIWRSEPTPPAQWVVQLGYSPELRKKLQNFLAEYGRARGPQGDAEREVLKTLQASLGYVAADDSALVPAATLEYQFARQRALNARWVSEAARNARLALIETSYRQQISALRETQP